MYWVHRWMNDPATTDVQRDTLRRLVAAGVIELTNGGWVMHDETVTHWESTIAQMSLGHDFIVDTFGVAAVPRYAWHIDPFGATGANAAFSARMGFSAFVVNRIPDDIKSRWARDRSLDFVWKTPVAGDEHNSELMTHVFDCEPSAPLVEFRVTWTAREAQHPAVRHTCLPTDSF